MITLRLASRLRRAPLDFGRWNGAVNETDAWQDRRWDAYTTTVRPESIGGDPDAAYARVREAVLRLDLFPEAKLALFVAAGHCRAELGATVIQRIYLGPIGFEAAVEVTDLYDDGPVGPRVSVTWTTVKGHPERGLEEFSAERLDGGAIRIDIRSKSRPAQLLVWLGYPVTRWIQRRYSNAAVGHLAAIGRGHAAS